MGRKRPYKVIARLRWGGRTVRTFATEAAALAAFDDTDYKAAWLYFHGSLLQTRPAGKIDSQIGQT